MTTALVDDENYGELCFSTRVTSNRVSVDGQLERSSGGQLEAALAHGLEQVRGLITWHRARERFEKKGEAPKTAPNRRELPRYVRMCYRCSVVILEDLGERGGYGHRAIAYRCGSWRCPNCSRRLAARLYERIRASHAEEPIEWAFTLTFRARPGVDPTPDELEALVGPAWKAFMHDFRKLVLYRGPKDEKARRKALKLCSYLKIIEWTIRGYPHIHGLLKRLPATLWFAGARANNNSMDNTRVWEEVPVTAELLQKEIVALAQKHGFGWRDDIQKIRSAEAAISYVASHTLKGYQLRNDYIKGFRRVTRSRDFMAPLPKRESSVVFLKRVNASLERTIEAITEEGGRVINPQADVLLDERNQPERLALASCSYEPGPNSHYDLRDCIEEAQKFDFGLNKT